MPPSKTVVYDLRLVRHRLKAILGDLDDSVQSLYADDELVESLEALERLVGSMIRGYEEDEELHEAFRAAKEARVGPDG